MIKTTLIYATETLTNTDIAQWAMADDFLLKWVNLLYDHMNLSILQVSR